MNRSTMKSREKSRYFETNENENTTIQSVWDTGKAIVRFKTCLLEKQDGGIGRHTVPPHTTRTDRKPNSKEVGQPRT